MDSGKSLTRKEIKQNILARKKSADKVLIAITSCPQISAEEFKELFTRYMCNKFMLLPREITTDDFYVICQMSVDTVAGLPPGTIDASEIASQCGGATTAMNKKVLFLLTVQREFGISFSTEETMNIDTLTQLTELVYHTYYKRRHV